MTYSHSRRLHASDRDRRRGAGQLARAFTLHLRAASPPLANLIDGCRDTALPSPVEVVIAAVLAQADGGERGAAVAAFTLLYAKGQAIGRCDVLLGRALLAALGDLLGPALDDPTHDAWASSYVALVEAVMAMQRGHLDRVA